MQLASHTQTMRLAVGAVSVWAVKVAPLHLGSELRGTEGHLSDKEPLRTNVGKTCHFYQGMLNRSVCTYETTQYCLWSQPSKYIGLSLLIVRVIMFFF